MGSSLFTISVLLSSLLHLPLNASGYPECEASACFQKAESDILQLKAEQTDTLTLIDPAHVAESTRYRDALKRLQAALDEVVGLLEGLSIDGDTITFLDERVRELQQMVDRLEEQNGALEGKWEAVETRDQVVKDVFDKFEELKGAFERFRAEVEALSLPDDSLESARESQRRFEAALESLKMSQDVLNSVINLCNQLEGIPFDWDRHSENEEALEEYRAVVDGANVDGLLDDLRRAHEQVENESRGRYGEIFNATRVKNGIADELIEYLSSLEPTLGRLKAAREDVDLWLNKTSSIETNLTNVISELKGAVEGSRDRGKLVKEEALAVLDIRFEETSDELEALMEKIRAILENLKVPEDGPDDEMERNIEQLIQDAVEISKRANAMVEQCNAVVMNLNEADKLNKASMTFLNDVTSAVDESQDQVPEIKGIVQETAEIVDAFCNHTQRLSSAWSHYKDANFRNKEEGRELRDEARRQENKSLEITKDFDEFEKQAKAADEELDLRRERDEASIQRFLDLQARIELFQKRASNMNAHLIEIQETISTNDKEINILETSLRNLTSWISEYQGRIQSSLEFHMNCKSNATYEE